MVGRTGEVAAQAAAVVTVVAGALVFWLAARVPALSSDEASSVANALFVVGMTVLAVTGTLLVRSGRHRVMGWLLLDTGLTNVLGRLALAIAVAAHEAGLGLSGGIGWVTNWCWLPGQALALLLILRFPDGGLPGRRWVIVQRVVLTWAVVALLVTALAPGPLAANQLDGLRNPIGLMVPHAVVDAALGLVFVVQPLLLVAVVLGPVLRWRTALPEERRQLKVVALALGFLAVATPLALASGAGRIAEGIAWLVLPAAIAYAVARHDLWDLELRRRFDRLRQVREEERSRLQRDLHDSLGPLLGSISMRLEAARNLLDAGAPQTDIDRVLASIGRETESAVVEVRRFIDELGPSALADTDLLTALHRLVDSHVEAGVPVTLGASDHLPPLTPAAEVALYRVASEGLRNVARHARATTCTVTLTVAGGDVVLEVRDDGVGLRGQPAGVGRRAMAERITTLGGAFVLSEPSIGGVQLTARIAGAAG